MADAVTSQVLVSNKTKYVGAFTNISDGTGESDVTKVDISGLIGAPTKVKINEVWFAIFGMSVEITTDHTADDTVLTLTGTGYFNFAIPFGGIVDPASAGGTGDVLFTTIGHAANDTYSIILGLGLKE